MKSKKKIIGILCVILVIILGGLIWWNVPSSIINIAPSEVGIIKIFNGNTGKTFIISDQTDIEHIIENLNAVSIKKEKISLNYMGYNFRTTIYKADGNVYKEFIINSSSIIRKNPFFYRDSSNSIDFNYIQELIHDNGK